MPAATATAPAGANQYAPGAVNMWLRSESANTHFAGQPLCH